MTTPNTIIADLQAENDALRKERDKFISAINIAAEQIRRCDYTPARSTLLQAIASVKGGAS